MTTTIGSAALTIIPSTKGFGSLLSSQITGQSAAAGAKAGNGMGQGILATAKRFVAPLAATFATASAFSFLKQSIQDAGALEQSIGAIDTVFGSSSGQMHKWGKTAATTLGLTRNEFNELGTLIGTQLKNGGTSMDELGGKTNNLITLGADLSAMFGGTTREAVEALSSALKGERDPIEKYGVSLTQAAINAKAAELGFQKVGGALSTEANQAATLALIMEQTADAHGRFAQESNTLAGQQQRLSASWGNLKTTIGTAFLPVATAALRVLNQFMPALQGMANGLVRFSESLFSPGKSIKDLGDTVGGLRGKADEGLGGLGAAASAAFGVLGPALAPIREAFNALLPTIRDLGPTFVQAAGLINPFGIILKSLLPIVPQLGATFLSVFGSILQAITPVLPLLAELAGLIVGALAQAFQMAMPIVTQLIEALGPIFSAILQALTPVLTELVRAFNRLLPPIMSLIPPILQVVQAFMPLLSVIANLISTLLPPLLDLVMAIIVPVADLAATIATALAPVISALAGVVSSTLVPALTAIVNVLAKVIAAILPVVSVIAGALCSAISTLIGWLVKAVTGITTFVANGVAAFSRFMESVRSTIGNVISIVSSIPGKISSLFASAGSWLVDKGRQIIQGLINGIGAVMGNVAAALGRIRSSVSGALSDAGSWLVGAGRNIIQGLINGIGQMGSQVMAKARSIAQNAVNTVKGALGIHSPSRVFMGIGEFMGEGMALGLEKSAAAVQSATDDLIPSVSFRTPDVRAGGLIGQLDAVAAASRGPSVLEVRDVDGDLIGRMQVEAGRVQSGRVTPLSHGKAKW